MSSFSALASYFAASAFYSNAVTPTRPVQASAPAPTSEEMSKEASMLSARSRKAPTYGVTYVSLEDCTLHFETEYIIERRDGSLAHMPMRTPVSEREALQRLIESCIDD